MTDMVANNYSSSSSSYRVKMDKKLFICRIVI